MKYILGIYISGKLWRKIHLNDYPEFLKGGTISLGRRETSDICIPQSTVSREHAYIKFDGKKVRIIDNNSLNGISVDGKQKKEFVLHDGMQVSIASAAGDSESVVIAYYEFADPEPKPAPHTESSENAEEKASEKPAEKPVRKRRATVPAKERLNKVGRRLVAAMADWAVVMFMCAGFCGTIVLTIGFGGIIKLILVLGLIAIVWLYFALSESGSNGSTFGKQLFSLKVEDKNGENISFRRASIRLVAKIFSMFTLLLPVFGKGRCLHDVIAGTRVVQINKKNTETEQV